MDHRRKKAASVEAPRVPTQSAGAWRGTLSFGLRRLVEVALGQALDVIVAEGGPMTSFVVLDRPSGRVIGRFDGEGREALARARAHVAACDADRAAVAWDGYLTVAGIRQDAVVVAASDRGCTGVVVAHRYRETVDGTVVVGKPVLVGPTDPLM